MDGSETSRRYVDVDGKKMVEIGVRIISVSPDSNAKRSGLIMDDVIHIYHGHRTNTAEELIKLITAVSQDESLDAVEVVAERKGEQLTLQVEKGKLGATITTQYGRESDAATPNAQQAPEVKE